jgi:hypothetical protein
MYHPFSKNVSRFFAGSKEITDHTRDHIKKKGLQTISVNP